MKSFTFLFSNMGPSALLAVGVAVPPGTGDSSGVVNRRFPTSTAPDLHFIYLHANTESPLLRGASAIFLDDSRPTPHFGPGHLSRVVWPIA